MSTPPNLPPYRCTITDENAAPCIRGRHHTGRHHFLTPVARIPRQRVGA